MLLLKTLANYLSIELTVLSFFAGSDLKHAYLILVTLDKYELQYY